MNAISIKCGLFMACLLGAAATASAIPYDVYAYWNSSSGSPITAGLTTVSLTAGDWLSISVNPLDLWNAGAPYRMSNANGLNQGNIYAITGDDSGQPPTTLIGTNYGLWTQDGFSAPYGALVGQIDSGSFFLVGTSYTGVAANTGVLELFYWDSNYGDNTGYVTANVRLPDGGLTAMLLGMGMMALGLVRRMLK